MVMSVGTKGLERRRRNRPMSEINVTPLVDVMLVLLIIFMVTAPMMTAGVQVDLPETSAKSLPGQDEPLEVTIAADGNIYLGSKNPITLKELAPKLRAVAGENKEKRIFVRGDKGVEYGQVMEVFGEINASGFTKVALVTEPRSRRQ